MAVFRVKNLSVSLVFLFSTILTCTSEMRLLQCVFRHGDRYPLAYEATKVIYPLNPHADASWYPNSDGGLTLEGKRRSYDLGELLRARYGDWFQHRYSKKIANFISAGNERALITASLVAAGLFPTGNGTQRWHPALDWQPVQIFSMRYPENILFYGCFFCSNYMELLEKTKLSDPIIVDYDERMKQYYDNLSSKIGTPVKNRILYYLYMEFLAVISGGLPPPNWAEKFLSDGSLEKAAIQEYRFSSWTEDLKRMTGGLWLKRWLDHVDEYINEKRAAKTEKKQEKNKKAFFYSGHDINVAGIMNTLGIFYPHVPNYASSINLELHEDENELFYVKVVHRDSAEFSEHVIPGCDLLLCPLDTFRNIFSRLLAFDASRDCGSFESK